jgi:DNA 3'-phosphatase
MEGPSVKRSNSGIKVDLHEESLLVLSNYDYKSKFYGTSPKLAIFDLDDTLVQTKNGRSFPKDADDWQILYPNVVQEKLKRLVKEGYAIFIVSNQLGVSKGFLPLENLEQRLTNILNELGISAYILASTREDEYRKPCIGAYEYIVNEILMEKLDNKFRSLDNASNLLKPIQLNSNNGNGNAFRYSDSNFQTKVEDDAKIVFWNLHQPKDANDTYKRTTYSDEKGKQFLINFSKASNFGLGAGISPSSFFCGDAAGRCEPEARDFSDSDLLFAVNCRLNFCLPEQLFLDKTLPPLNMPPQFRFSSLIVKSPSEFADSFLKQNPMEQRSQSVLIILTGPPSCGKSTFAQKHFSKFTILSYVISIGERTFSQQADEIARAGAQEAEVLHPHRQSRSRPISPQVSNRDGKRARSANHLLLLRSAERLHIPLAHSHVN